MEEKKLTKLWRGVQDVFSWDPSNVDSKEDSKRSL